MKTLIFLLLALGGSVTLVAQDFKVLEVKGDVKFQKGTEESWYKLEKGVLLNNDAVISTGENSSAQLQGNDFKFTLKENSALAIGSIKTMTLDELLLALAMEDLINAPKTNGNGTSDNTAVYGTEENGKKLSGLKSDSFGLKRLNGAMQLAKSELTESALVFAKETYRKYPYTKSYPSYRIYFANLLYEKGLYEEALAEFQEINRLELNEKDREQVDSILGSIKKILMSN